MVLAVDPRAVAELARLVLLDHLGDAAVCEDVAGVDQAVQHLGRLLDQIRLVRVLVQLVICNRGRRGEETAQGVKGWRGQMSRAEVSLGEVSTTGWSRLGV